MSRWAAAAPVDPDVGRAVGRGADLQHRRHASSTRTASELPAGEVGEFVTTGPQVVAGYWNKPEETEHAIPGGHLHTGDVGFMDADGWFYLVDRKKDMIIASGYKVWPREVENVLYQHPAVREAAVIGVPDEYRGETVKAFVSLRPGEEATEAELIAFCKERMAAYKYPRSIEFVDELPKTVTGKILHRELRRDRATTPTSSPECCAVRVPCGDARPAGASRHSGQGRQRSWSDHSVSLRSTGLRTLPPALRGSGSLRNVMNCGALKSAIRSRANARISAGIGRHAGPRARSTAPTFSPIIVSGTPSTATSNTAGCSTSAFSTSTQ